LAATVSHFPEIELLGSRCNTNLTEDQVDTLWTQTCQASKSLTVFIPPSIARGSLDDMGEEEE
jgi:hypothetical protein